MPYIGTHTTVEITPEKEVVLKEKLGKAIEAIPGKAEAWLMCGFEDNCRLWFELPSTLRPSKPKYPQTGSTPALNNLPPAKELPF